MFTKNWYKALAGVFFYCYDKDTYIGVEGTNQYIRTPSSVTRLCENNDGSGYPSLHKMRTGLNGNGGVVIGTGTKAPAVDDYALDGDVITTYTYSVSLSKKYDGTGAEVTALYTITNTGSKAFTVGEIGLIAELGSYGNPTMYKALLERTVLDSPITIDPGGVGQITYTLRMNYPT